MPERVRSLRRHRAAFCNLGFTCSAVFVGDFSEIVEVIEKHILDVGDGGFDIARQRLIDEKQRARRAFAHGSLCGHHADDDTRRRRRADHNIEFREPRVSLFERHRAGAQSSRSMTGLGG